MNKPNRWPRSRESWRTITLEEVQELLAAGAEVDDRDGDGDTPLHEVCEGNKNPAVIKALLDAGAEVNARDGDGDTPLHRAAFANGNPAVIHALIAAGAEVNARDNNGNTTLHLSARYNWNPEVTQALLDAGAEVNARGVSVSPTYFANCYNKNPAVIKVLYAWGGEWDKEWLELSEKRKRK